MFRSCCNCNVCWSRFSTTSSSLFSNEYNHETNLWCFNMVRHSSRIQFRNRLILSARYNENLVFLQELVLLFTNCSCFMWNYIQWWKYKISEEKTSSTTRRNNWEKVQLTPINSSFVSYYSIFWLYFLQYIFFSLSSMKHCNWIKKAESLLSKPLKHIHEIL